MGRGHSNVLYAPTKRTPVRLLSYQDLPLWLRKLTRAIDLQRQTAYGDPSVIKRQEEQRDHLLARIPFKNGAKLFSIRQHLAVQLLEHVHRLLASPCGQRWSDAEAYNRVGQLLQKAKEIQANPKASGEQYQEFLQPADALVADAEKQPDAVKKAWAVQIAVVSLRLEFSPYAYPSVEPTKILTELSEFYSFFEENSDDVALSQEQWSGDESRALMAGLEEIAAY